MFGGTNARAYSSANDNPQENLGVGLNPHVWTENQSVFLSRTGYQPGYTGQRYPA